MREFNAELHDDRINFMGLNEPKIINYLNPDDLIIETPETLSQMQYGTCFALSISNVVTKQKRVVYDIFMLFGDVGGLYDFIFLILASVLGFWSEAFMRSSLVQKLYLADHDRSNRRTDTSSINLTSLRLNSLTDLFQSVKPMLFKKWFVVLNTLTCSYFPRDR